MHTRSLFIWILSLMLLSPLAAQTPRDALIHTQSNLTGTARSLGMGGAFSAVGADLTSATLNPAGLGFYRSSSFAVTPEVNFIRTEANFLDRTSTASEALVRLPSLGIAFNTMNYRTRGRQRELVDEGIVSYTFAIGYNNLENYNRTSSVSGAFNPYSSITDQWAAQSQGIPAADLNVALDNITSYSQLYYAAFAINPLPDEDGAYFPSVNDGRITQTVQIAESGRRNEWYAALGANFSNRFYLGGAIGLQQIRYENIFDFNEADLDNFHEFYVDEGNQLEFPFESLAFTERFTTRGTGLNGKFGLIYRPVDALRIGISAQTPTFFSLTDEITTTELGVSYIGTDSTGEDLPVTVNGEIPPGEFDYNLTTPFRATAGLMVLLGKKGFVSADVEYVDYSAASFGSASGSINDPNVVDFSPENSEISQLFQQAVNLRLGGEARIDMFRLRAGFAYHSSPLSRAGQEYLALQTGARDFRDLVGQDPADLAATRQLDAERLFFTLGAGIRQPNFFLDVSLVNQRQMGKVAPYTVGSDEIFQPTLTNERIINRLVVSLGFNY